MDQPSSLLTTSAHLLICRCFHLAMRRWRSDGIDLLASEKPFDDIAGVCNQSHTVNIRSSCTYWKRSITPFSSLAIEPFPKHGF